MKIEKCQLFNIYVHNIGWDEVLWTIEDRIREGIPFYIVEINVDVMLKMERDPYLRQIASEAGLVLVDGKPLIWISKWFGRPVREKISGSDLVDRLCENASEKGHSVFILGGKDGVPEKAAQNLKRMHPSISIAGTYAPPWGFENDQEELNRINGMIADASPDLLLVCLGCPKQERWVYENYQKCGAKVLLCAGASVDFLAGTVKRAPKWMSEHGLEWFYRFLKEPGRLFKRYFIDDMKIFYLMWKYRK